MTDSMQVCDGGQPLSQKHRLRVGQGGSLTPCTSPAGSGPCTSRCGYSHTWGPMYPGVSPSLEPTESPSKLKLVEKLRRTRQNGGPWKGGKEGIKVQTGDQPSPHMNLSAWAG